MTKLRCWPGALARVLEGPLKDRFIECDQVHQDHDGDWMWTYKGERLMGFVDGKLLEANAIGDAILQPITPPPSNRERLREILIAQGFHNPDTFIAPEEVTP